VPSPPEILNYSTMIITVMIDVFALIILLLGVFTSVFFLFLKLVKKGTIYKSIKNTDAFIIFVYLKSIPKYAKRNRT